MANKAQEQYKKDIKEKKQKIQKAISEMSDAELKEHMDRVANVYKTHKSPDLLGDLHSDPHNVYHWHTYEDDSGFKLKRRKDLGWGFATKEDAMRLGLLDERLSDRTIDGETCVEMSHKSHRAVLLKMPRELHTLNQKVKERVRANKYKFDVDGNEADVKESRGDSKIVRKRNEGILGLE